MSGSHRLRPDREDLLRRVEEMAPWFYDFDLGQGVRTATKLPPEVAAIHETRARMLRDLVRSRFAGRTGEIAAIDIGCHEGYFSFLLAREGFRDVLGVDVRAESLEKAAFVRDVLGLGNVRFRRADCERLGEAVTESFDLSLAVGLIYHLENPILCLRNAARATRDTLVVETQVIDGFGGETEWGRRDRTRAYRGVFALIDESGEFDRGCPEAGATPLALCPSLEAVRSVLYAVGFRETEVLPAPPGSYEQHRRGKRVMIAAYRSARNTGSSTGAS